MVDIVATAHATARAVAEAVAVTSVQCEGTGAVEGSGAAVARASANATASAQAIARGFVSVETCSGCEVAASTIAQSSADLFVEAIAASRSEVRCRQRSLLPVLGDDRAEQRRPLCRGHRCQPLRGAPPPALCLMR